MLGCRRAAQARGAAHRPRARHGDSTAFHRYRARVFEDIDAAPPIIASALARCGDFDRAFEVPRSGIAQRDPVLADGVRVHPGMDPLHSDPRWQEILRAMGIA